MTGAVKAFSLDLFDRQDRKQPVESSNQRVLTRPQGQCTQEAAAATGRSSTLEFFSIQPNRPHVSQVTKWHLEGTSEVVEIIPQLDKSRQPPLTTEACLVFVPPGPPLADPGTHSAALRMWEKDARPPMREALLPVHRARAGNALRENYLPRPRLGGQGGPRKVPVAGPPATVALRPRTRGEFAGKEWRWEGRWSSRREQRALGGGRRGLPQQRQQTPGLEPGE